jgi:hypothetical protein
MGGMAWPRLQNIKTIVWVRIQGELAEKTGWFCRFSCFSCILTFFAFATPCISSGTPCIARFNHPVWYAT